MSSRRVKKVQFQKRQNGARRMVREEQQQEDALVLPTVFPQLAQGITMRFKTTTAFTGVLGVTFYNLLDTWIIAGTATAGYQLWDYVKVKRVTVRATGQFLGGTGLAVPTCTVEVEFPGLVAGAQGSGQVKSSTSISPMCPAIASLKPGPKALAGMWQPSSNDTAFVIRAVDNLNAALLGAIIDVELAFKNNPLVAPQTIASAIAGATAGQIYFGNMDGARVAATAARTVFSLAI